MLIDSDDVTMDQEENTISPPDPSMIDKPVIRDYNVPSGNEEDSIVEEVPSEIIDSESDSSDSDTCIWEVIEKGTERGMPKLVNKLGYSYAVTKVRNSTRYWGCSVQNSNIISSPIFRSIQAKNAANVAH